MTAPRNPSRSFARAKGEPKAAAKAAAKTNGHDRDIFPDPKIFTLKYWNERELPPPDFLLGEAFATTSRVLLAAPTGCGKTGIATAFAYAMAAGQDFLHWRIRRAARNVALIDGEMSSRVGQVRLRQVIARHGDPLENFFYINRDDFPSMPPLNTSEGQKFMDRVLAEIGDVDFVILDNMQALLSGNLRDEEPWSQTLAWARSLTRRAIGQLWITHTGPSGIYGNKTVEWQMDSVGIMKDLRDPQQPDGLLTDFRLEWTKARERSPENRSDFTPAHIWIENNTWQSSIEPGGTGKRAAKLSPSATRHLDELKRAIDDGGALVPTSNHVPVGSIGITEKLWRQLAYKANISDGTDDAKQKAFKRAAEQLMGAGVIDGWDGWVWLRS